MTAELIVGAVAGDGEAFRELTEPHRRELLMHCYRMLGSFQDAEDAVQDTLVSAWQHVGGFEERSSVRTWLYRIATNRCLDALRAHKRRSAAESTVSGFEPPAPSRIGEVVWLEPYPDDALPEGSISAPLGPEARYEQTEAISLAFVTALQLLPPRQRAVLILREVLGYHATEVADMLDSTPESVTSALKRARAAVQRLSGRDSAPAPHSPAERALVTRFVRAYEAGNVDTLVELLTADVVVSMPPIPLAYHGLHDVAAFYASVFGSGRRYDLVPTRANGQPAFGAYVRTGCGIRRAGGLLVVTLDGDRIAALTRFDNSVLSRFGLPQSLPARC